MPRPGVAQEQEVSSTSDSEKQPAKKEILMMELNEAATKEYPIVADGGEFQPNLYFKIDTLMYLFVSIL